MSPPSKLPRRAAPPFDFDEWATLYRLDPVAFEARRHAVLQLHIMKQRRSAPKLRALMQAFDAECVNKTALERAALAQTWMLASASLLAEKFERRQELVAAPAVK